MRSRSEAGSSKHGQPATGRWNEPARPLTWLGSNDAASRALDPTNQDVHLITGYLSSGEADGLFAALRALCGWRQDSIRLFGKTHPLPRLHRWFALSTQAYRWSGIDMQPEPFPAAVLPALMRLRKETGVPFNSALANWYRDGRDSVGWHADDEPELGDKPAIASLSLGDTRRFVLRRKRDLSTRVSLQLTHGSLLWMAGSTQQEWEHSVPKTAKPVGARINLTFRVIQDSTRRMYSARCASDLLSVLAD